MEVLWFVGGFAAGLVISFGYVIWLRGRLGEWARGMAVETQREKVADLERMIGQLKESFGSLSQTALAASNQQFLELAKTRLDGQTVQGVQQLEAKKTLIDAQLQGMAQKLTELNTLMQSLEKDRRESQGAIVSQLKGTTEITTRLERTTSDLRAALANPQRRGEWGQRMAEDVLRVAGFIEGVNYSKQTTTETGSRPDFTFPLPGEVRVHMDVKFPLANYLRLIETQETDPARKTFRDQFLRDVRGRIKEVTTRDYIDPANGTVDCVLLFIPNEQVYGFIHQHDADVIDDALRQRVILCSPITLFAVLAVIRRAVESFHLRKASDEILSLLAEFRKQWLKFNEVVEKMGKRLDDAVGAYRELTSTRSRSLERQLQRIDDLAQERGVVLPDGDPEAVSNARERPNVRDGWASPS